MDNKKVLIFSGVVSLVLIGLLIGVSFIGGENIVAAPAQESLESCKTLQFNGRDKINLVFFSPEETTREYSDFMFGFSPYDEHRDDFNVFFIDDYEPECEIYKDVATFCPSRELSEKATSCPNDYIIVIDEDKNADIRSSSYKNVLSVNKKTVWEVLLHEFGHAQGNLAEEYVTGKNPSRGSKNCVAECEEFNGETDGCFEGCSGADFKRSVNEGFMRTLSSDTFGVFDANLLEARILEAVPREGGITGNVVAGEFNCEEERYYSVRLNVAGEVIEVVDKSVKTGCGGTNGFGDSSYSVLDEQGNIIETGKFNLQVFTDGEVGGEFGGETFDYSGEFDLNLPLDSSSDSLVIEHDGRTSEFSLGGQGGNACLS